jgi:hypothetical protein
MILPRQHLPARPPSLPPSMGESLPIRYDAARVHFPVRVHAQRNVIVSKYMSPHASANIAQINDAGSINIVNRAIICRMLTRDEIAGRNYLIMIFVYSIVLFSTRHNANVRFNIPISGGKLLRLAAIVPHLVRVFHA